MTKALIFTLLVSIAGFSFASIGVSVKNWGDDTGKASKSLLTGKAPVTSFSLKSGYQFRGNQVITPEKPKVIDLSTVITYQKGNTTFSIPLKKKILVDNVKFSLSL